VLRADFGGVAMDTDNEEKDGDDEDDEGNLETMSVEVKAAAVQEDDSNIVNADAARKRGSDLMVYCIVSGIFNNNIFCVFWFCVLDIVLCH
jgi:hypothetical protein